MSQVKIILFIIVSWLLVYFGAVYFLKGDFSKLKNEGSSIPSAQSTESTLPDLITGQSRQCGPTEDNHQYYRTDQTLVVDPNDPQILYVSVEHKGFYKSLDGGQTWQQKTNGIRAYAQKDDPTKPCHGEYPITVIDPKNSNRVILGLSGSPTTFDSGYSEAGGLVESTNAAESWQQLLRGWMNIYVTDIAIDPNDSAVMYYGTTSAPASNTEADPNKIFVTKGLVYKTVDSGKSWEELPTGYLPHMGATRLFINLTNSQELLVFTFAAPRQEGGRKTDDVAQLGLLRSVDGGKIWTQTKSLPAGYEAVLIAANAPKNFLHLFVSPSNSGDKSPKSFFSNDGGNTFAESSKYLDLIEYDPHDAAGNRLIGYAWQGVNGPAQKLLYESKDNGKTWQTLGSLPSEIKDLQDGRTRVSKIVFDPKSPTTFYLSGAGANVWKSADNGQTWQSLLNLDKLPNK